MTNSRIEPGILANRYLRRQAHWKNAGEDDDFYPAERCSLGQHPRRVLNFNVEHARKFSVVIEPLSYKDNSDSNFSHLEAIADYFEKNIQLKGALELLVLPPTNKIVGEWVGEAVCRAFINELPDCQNVLDKSEQAAAKKIEQSLRYTLNSIAKGVLDAGSNEFELARDGRFVDHIARAILIRLPVGFYKERDFIIDLHHDFSQAAGQNKIKHSWWSVKSEPGGVLKLYVDVAIARAENNEGEEVWTKARPVRFSELTKKQ